MLRFLADQDFNQRIVRGLSRRLPHCDIISVWDIPALVGQDDVGLLEWAADEQRIVLTHDANTMTLHASARVASGLPMAGLVIAPQTLSIGQVIDDLILIDGASLSGEWDGQVRYLPLQ